MTRAVITLSKAALQHNLQIIRQQIPDVKIMAAIKANGYGHGLQWVSQQLHDADAFGVAVIEEAKQLLKSGCNKSITLLEGFQSVDDAGFCAAHGLHCVIHHTYQLDLIENYTLERRLKVWLKIDTGMHRLGIQPEDVSHTIKRIESSNQLEIIGLMTHLANADDVANDASTQQINTFKAIANHYPYLQSIANSAGILAWESAHTKWVRPGIMLYGASPFIPGQRNHQPLKPVMTLKSPLIAINHYKKGSAIGYGSTWQCPQDMAVGVVAIGYGDGYPRHAPSGTPVVVNGIRTSVVGRVSMDMITIDLRPVPQAKIGDVVTLWGDDLPVEEVADAAGTISYELFCRLTARVAVQEI